MALVNKQINLIGRKMKGFDFSAVGSLALKFLGLLLVILMPIKSALIATAFLVFADFVTGLWASIKEKKPITSSGFRRTLVKTIAYYAAIIIAFVLETYLMQDLPIVKAMTGLVGLIEGKSFFENLRRITGIDFWSYILSKMNMDDVKAAITSDKKDDPK